MGLLYCDDCCVDFLVVDFYLCVLVVGFGDFVCV